MARGRPVAACSSASPPARPARARAARRRPCRATPTFDTLSTVRNSISGCETNDDVADDPAREGVGAPPRALGARRARPPLHRPPPRPRGHQPAGVRRPAAVAVGGCAGPSSPSRPRTTTSRPRTSTSRSPTRSRPARSRCCARTRPSSASRTYPMGDPGQGIVHVIGPEQGRTLPGMTIVCGDSHTATHGAFGALAFGIGTSEVEHVLATQTLPQTRPKWMAVDVEGELPAGVTAKDVILAVIGQIGTGGGIGHVIEYRGSTIRGALDGGAHDRLQHVDRGRRQGRAGRPRRHHVRLPRGPGHAPTGAAWDAGASRSGESCAATTARRGTSEVHIDAATLRPQVTWGTNPGQVASIDGAVPVARRLRRPDDPRDRRAGARVHGPDGRHADPRHPRRHRVHRLVHEQPHRGPARRRRRARRPPRHRQAGDGRARQPRREGAGRSRGAATGSSPPPAPTGASRVARCAWR